MMLNKPLRSQEEASAFIMKAVAVDAKIAPLVRMLNSYSGIATFGSCGGHKDHNDAVGQMPENQWYVTFSASENHDGLTSLKRIVSLCNFIFGIQVDVALTWLETHYGLLYTVSGVGCDPNAAAAKLDEFKNLSVDAIMATMLEVTFE